MRRNRYTPQNFAQNTRVRSKPIPDHARMVRVLITTYGYTLSAMTTSTQLCHHKYRKYPS